jgi:hypothetical protein
VKVGGDEKDRGIGWAAKVGVRDARDCGMG